MCIRDRYVTDGGVYDNLGVERPLWYFEQQKELDAFIVSDACLLYTSDAADERSSVDLGGRRIIKKKNNI